MYPKYIWIRVKQILVPHSHFPIINPTYQHDVFGECETRASNSGRSRKYCNTHVSIKQRSRWRDRNDVDDDGHRAAHGKQICIWYMCFSREHTAHTLLCVAPLCFGSVLCIDEHTRHTERATNHIIKKKAVRVRANTSNMCAINIL